MDEIGSICNPIRHARTSRDTELVERYEGAPDLWRAEFSILGLAGSFIAITYSGTLIL